MNWYKKAQTTQIGFRVVAWDGQRATSLQEERPVNLHPGSVEKYIYLGTSEQFCIDYYSGLSNTQDMLLTYAYSPTDIVSGGGENSEVFVRSAVLKGSRML